MLPIKEPSQTLFQLLGLLIEYGERISGVTDMMAGQTPGQNTPATTAMAALEQGQKVFTGIHKRVYRALRDEFRKLYRLNRDYLEETTYFQVLDTEEAVFRNDYQGDPTDIKPTADPNVSSSQQRLAKAMMVKEVAMTGTSQFNMYAIDHAVLEAGEIPNIDVLHPDPNGPNAIPQAEDPELEIKSAEFEANQKFRAQELDIKRQQAMADIIVKKTQAILNIAKAEAAEDGTQLQAYKQELDQLQMHYDQIEAERNYDLEQRRLRGMEAEPRNSGGAEVS